MSTSVNLLEHFEKITDYWSPKVVGQVNDQYIKLVKLKGNLAWHKHDNEDELFLVIHGKLRIEMEDRDTVELQSGEFFTVPRGVMHNPIASDECWIMLIETVTTKHTGDVVTDRTRTIKEQLSLD